MSFLRSEKGQIWVFFSKKFDNFYFLVHFTSVIKLFSNKEVLPKFIASCSFFVVKPILCGITLQVIVKVFKGPIRALVIYLS